MKILSACNAYINSRQDYFVCHSSFLPGPQKIPYKIAKMNTLVALLLTVCVAGAASRKYGFLGSYCKSVGMHPGQTAFIRSNRNQCVNVVCPDIGKTVLEVNCVAYEKCGGFGSSRTCYATKKTKTSKGLATLSSRQKYNCVVSCIPAPPPQPTTTQEPITTPNAAQSPIDDPTAPGSADNFRPTTPVITLEPITVTTPSAPVNNPTDSFTQMSDEPTETSTQGSDSVSDLVSDSSTQVSTEPTETSTQGQV